MLSPDAVPRPRQFPYRQNTVKHADFLPVAPNNNKEVSCIRYFIRARNRDAITRVMLAQSGVWRDECAGMAAGRGPHANG